MVPSFKLSHVTNKTSTKKKKYNYVHFLPLVQLLYDQCTRLFGLESQRISTEVHAVHLHIHYCRINCMCRKSVINKIIKFMLTGINKFWMQPRVILAWAARQGLKWLRERPKNIFMPKNINSTTLWRHWGKIGTEKVTTKHSEQLQVD